MKLKSSFCARPQTNLRLTFTENFLIGAVTVGIVLICLAGALCAWCGFTWLEDRLACLLTDTDASEAEQIS